jgi:hypothetical protein
MTRGYINMFNVLYKFKPGDRVIVNSLCDSYGEIGTVNKYVTYVRSIYVEVLLDSGQVKSYMESSLKFVDVYGKEETKMLINEKYNVATVKFLYGHNLDKEYNFALFDKDVTEGDFVLCDTTNGYSVGTICKITYPSEFKTKVTREIICKIDFSAFEKRKRIRKEKLELKEKLDAAVAENKDLAIYQTIAQGNPEVAKLLEQYKALLAE